MRNFEILFDRGEPSPISDTVYTRYGNLGFPAPPADRPWIYTNFVQSLDGIVSYRGELAAASNISKSEEDRWLMDLLRSHADAILLGINTLVEETLVRGAEKRGPVFRIVYPELQDLRQRLGKKREKNILLTGSGNIDLANYRVFDGEILDAILVTTEEGAGRIKGRESRPHVQIITIGDAKIVDLQKLAEALRRELGIEHLLCEGGPQLYGNLARAGLIDEKFLTIAPFEIGQIVPPDQPPAAWENPSERLRPTIFGGRGFTIDQATQWQWISCRRVGSHEFNRYRRA